MGNDNRKSVLGAAIAAAFALIGPIALAQPQAAPLVEFHIAPQPLAQALNAWAQQCGLQLIWPADGGEARRNSPPVHGKFEPMQALELLLQDSGLKYSVLKEGTVTLEDQNASKSPVVAVSGASEGE